MVSVGELIAGHGCLDVQCMDRIYLNGYVPNLQVSGQVVTFMTHHMGCPIPSPALMEKLGTTFPQVGEGLRGLTWVSRWFTSARTTARST